MQGQQTFSEGPDGKYCGFAGHMVSLSALRLSLCSRKVTMGSTRINTCGYVPLKCYLQKQVAGLMRAIDHSLDH